MKKNNHKQLLTQLSFFVTLLLGIFLTILFPDITRFLALVTFLSIIVFEWFKPGTKTAKQLKLNWNQPLKLSLFICLFSQGILLYENVAPSLAAKFATQQTEQTEEIATSDNTTETTTASISEEKTTQSKQKNNDNTSNPSEKETATQAHENSVLEVATLQRVVNGNTVYLTVNGQTEKYRLLVIDTPDDSSYSTLASQATQRLNELLTNATQLYVSYDPAISTTDAFGRQLVYLWADDDLVQTTLLEEGLAQISYIDSEKLAYLADMQQAQKTAKLLNKGLWENYGTTTYEDSQTTGLYGQDDISRLDDQTPTISDESENKRDEFETHDDQTTNGHHYNYDQFENWYQSNESSQRTYSYNR
ncbi:thermonuclease family protein [Vagococcus zengguangii]|uniref:Thermonuclease family protein n=1 Tax=Vagococcus zengguangii TaxID=2571750 RepID=A0A4D7CUY1_9ENTE|nr:thermonuclease family protein [Vagococcus zengguangii]QCI86121.1 thermonuclease family protein [Vagococcus zengguangii]